jgi:propionyl-CoA carboxylase beta chain
MGSKGGAPIWFSMPGAVIATMNRTRARASLQRRNQGGPFADEAVVKIREGSRRALRGCRTGAVDDVIAPEATRQYLISAVDMLYSKRESVLARKHGNKPRKRERSLNGRIFKLTMRS